MTEEQFIALARQQWAELQAIKQEQSFYEFEQQFDGIVRDFNRQVLEGTIGEVPKDHRKKKLLSKYGKVEVANNHLFMEEVQGSPITPCLKKKTMVYLAQSELYTEAPHVFELLTGQKQSQSSFWRLAQDCGQELEALLEQEEPLPTLAANEVVYCMGDGSMIFTDDGWQEVKLGRVFIEPIRRDKNEQRPVLASSQYAAHLGQHEAFERKMDVLLKGYAHLGKRVVCISDGALWLKHYWHKCLPEAELILDFWHVMEKLGEVAWEGFADEATRKAWLEQQREYLQESKLETVKANIQSLPAQKYTIDKLGQYLDNNAFRMDYKRYLQAGLRIGSGAMEAAHRTVIQSRMKRSRQRWSDRGAQNLLNLRVAYKSGKARLVRQIITGKLPDTVIL